VSGSTRFGGLRPLADRSRIQLALGIAERIAVGRLVLELPDGSVRTVASGTPGPCGHLRLHRLRAIRRFVTGGSLGFAEAYLDGDWDSDDLPQTLEVLALNDAAYAHEGRARGLTRLLARARHLLRANSRSGSRRNVLAHYDLGNEFFRRWLDPGMTYSSARFDGVDVDLGTAQQRKFESLVAVLDPPPDSHLLEIGCGWGGFAEYLATTRQARVTAITISDEQHAYAARRIHEAGLGERVEVRLQDYRDVDGRFDGIASIEMLEGVGERYWPVFFARLRDVVKPGGRIGIQAITIADHYFDAYRKGCDFIQRHVFPGGMLPSPAVLERETARAGLVETDRHTFGADYGRTLDEWNRRFQAAWSEVRELGFDDRFKRLWEYYLAYCAAGFKVGFTDVLQIGLTRR
jgi:cyclopropane-fatty-acyl-phospholipid synthase